MAYVDRLLAPGETVIHRTRRHWVVLLQWVGSAAVLVVLGLLMAGLFRFRFHDPTTVSAAWVGVALALIGLLVALPAWLRWENEVYLVTDRRVIRVEGVFRKQALDSGLSKVNDVRLTQTLPGRLLGYGTLEIITASESGINRLDYLPSPLAFKKAMMTATEGGRSGSAPAVEQAAAVGGAAPRASARRTAADRLAELDELRQRGLVSEEEYRAKRAAIVDDL
ncbi:MAG TPA: PH domain-containing protein [Thermoanaerobaculia bacterium]|jgi:uncharacterized membrane protein YdbT with pleckstrin-like domain|nr:PH domain-containing protein [Thermoanaerobaculia bacterium]